MFTAFNVVIALTTTQSYTMTQKLFEAYEDAFDYFKTTINEDYEYGLIADTIKDITLYYEDDKWEEEAGAKQGDDLYYVIDNYDIVYVISTMIVH